MHMNAPSPLPAPPSMNGDTRIRPGERALVLGGGGSTGNAWNLGILAGLASAGLAAAAADVLIGTSAGATTAVQIAGADPAVLFAAVSASAPPVDRAAPSRVPPTGANEHLERLMAHVAGSADMADYRRRLSAAALAKDEAAPEWSARWRSTVATRLPFETWPDRQLLLTAVDAVTAEPVVFDRHSGIDLVDAVAASCASGPAYRVGAQRFIDGGFRTNAENADLAAGCGRVLVLSPFGGDTLTPPTWGLHLAHQVEALRAGGSRVEVLSPREDVAHLFGANAMDHARRPTAARAGWAQGKAEGAALAAFWG